jgi:hypothetical protein
MESVLRERVGQLRRRVRLLVTARWVFAALVAAALLCSVLVVLDRLEWVSAPPEYLAGLFALAALAGAVIGLTRPVSLMDVAQGAPLQRHRLHAARRRRPDDRRPAC